MGVTGVFMMADPAALMLDDWKRVSVRIHHDLSDEDSETVSIEGFCKWRDVIESDPIPVRDVEDGDVVISIPRSVVVSIEEM